MVSTSGRGPVAEDVGGRVLALGGSGRARDVRRQRGKRAEQVAGESTLEQRVRPQLGHLEHRLAAAVGWAQQHVPLVARATAEKRFDGGDEVGVERAVGPLWMTGCGAEALPEFR